FPGRVPSCGAQVVVGDLGARCDFRQHLEGLCHDLGTDPVTGDHREPHPIPPSSHVRRFTPGTTGPYPAGGRLPAGTTLRNLATPIGPATATLITVSDRSRVSGGTSPRAPSARRRCCRSVPARPASPGGRPAAACPRPRGRWSG